MLRALCAISLSSKYFSETPKQPSQSMKLMVQAPKEPDPLKTHLWLIYMRKMLISMLSTTSST